MKTKNKYLTFSFDDCEIYDRILCDMLRKYGMKATFFLISNKLGRKTDFLRYGENTVVERVSSKEITETYASMEVASHTADHMFEANNIEGSVVNSLEILSELCGYEVKGLAYPGGCYTSEYVEKLKQTEVKYARTAGQHCTLNFDVPTEWLTWHPTCKYDDKHIKVLVDKFLAYQGSKPIVFHIYGHSYEMTRKEEGCGFADFELLLKKLCNRDDIVYATNIEVWEALK